MKFPEMKRKVAFTYVRSNGFSVYSDLGKEDMQHIPGVSRVSVCGDGHLVVDVNPRYDTREVMDYISHLFNHRRCECDCDAKTFTVYCNIPLNDLCRIPGVESATHGYCRRPTHREITVKAGHNVSEIKKFVTWLANGG